MSVKDAIEIINRAVAEHPAALIGELRRVSHEHAGYALMGQSRDARRIAAQMAEQAVYLADLVDDCVPLAGEFDDTGPVVIAFSAACKALGLSNREATEIMSR